MRQLLIFLALALPLAAQTKDTAPRGLTSVAFASLGTPANGTIVYCSDCTATNPSAGSGSDAVARRENGAWNSAGGGGSSVIASGTAALGTSAISSGACATVVTAAATGTLTTDNIVADFNADPTAVTGYTPSVNGMLAIIKYPTVDTVNFKICNNTSGSVSPGAITLNWRVIR